MKAADSSKDSRTDWARLADPSDDDIDYSDIPPLDDAFFESATWRMPTGQEQVTLRLDRDVLSWFQAQGKGYQRRMSSILRAYKKAHEGA